MAETINYLLNTKWIVTSPEESEAIQLFLFANGLSWWGQGTTISYLHKPFLYVGTDGFLGYGDSRMTYDECSKEEMCLSRILKEEWEAL